MLGTSVTGGLVYTGTNYPKEYHGSYFFGDYGAQRLYTLGFDQSGVLTRQPEPGGFGSGIGHPVKFAAAANGDIVYADIVSRTLKRLVYAPGNRAPTATAVITNDAEIRRVTFDGTGSYDLDGGPLTHVWDFGDGATDASALATHTYATPGTFTAKLTVTDQQGARGSATYRVVPANNLPVVALKAPSPDEGFEVGDTVTLTAEVTDVEDGTLTPNWQVVQVHCSGGYCHDHPQGDPPSGALFSTTFLDHGEDTRLEITASATDQAGTTTRKTYVARPKLRSLTVASNVPSAITMNGAARTTSQVTVGATVSLAAPTTAIDGVATFDRWTGLAPQQHEIVMPDNNITLEATYLTPIDRRYVGDASLRAVVGAPTAPEAGDATLRYRDHVGGRIYWSPRAGVHEVHGAIYGTYRAAGAHVSFGEPLTDEAVLPDGVGRRNDFFGAGPTGVTSIYWSPQTGAHLVYGAVGALWRSMGAERGTHGYPTSSEAWTANRQARFNSFQNGGIYWRSSTGATSVHGAIYARWSRHGRENGFLGSPLISETATPDRIGRYNHFDGGSIYWSPRTGAFEVHGGIRARWQSLGWERSYLGYPISDEFSITGGRRSNFQFGYVTWNASTGRIIDRRY